jgi:hypothetical protein
MADTPLRRVINIVVDLNPDGTVKELNRGSYSDEYIGRFGRVEPSLFENVDEASLATLLPDSAALVAQIAAMRGERDVAVSDAAAAVAAKEVAETEAARLRVELDALKAAPALPDDQIHAAYVKQALHEMDMLDEVNGAAIAAGKFQLWDNATSFNLREPDVVAIAAMLGIDLAEVRSRALAVKAGNSGE